MHIGEGWIARIRAELPELPEARRDRYTTAFGLSAYDAGLLTDAPATANLFEYATEKTGRPKEAANWILGDYRKLHNEAGVASDEAKIDPDALVAVIRMIEQGRATRDAARTAFRAAYLEGLDPDTYIQEHGLGLMKDDGALRETAARIIAANPVSVADYRAGKEKALQFLIGQCMRELRGRADELFAAVLDGTLDVRIGNRFPLAEAAEARLAQRLRKRGYAVWYG